MARGIVDTITTNIKEGAETAITGRRAQDTQSDMDVTVQNIVQKLTPVKVFIMLVVGFIVGMGARFFFMDLSIVQLIKYIGAYQTYVLAVTPVLGLLISIVGTSGIIKHSKWAKEK